MRDTGEFERVVVSPEALKARLIDAYTYGLGLIQSGRRVHLVVREARDPIRTQQRKFLRDVVLGQAAEKIFIGEKRVRFSKQIWYEFFRARLLGSRWTERQMPNEEEAHLVEERVSGEELGAAAYSQFTDAVIDLCVVEYGVHFEFERAEHDAVRRGAQ